MEPFLSPFLSLVLTTAAPWAQAHEEASMPHGRAVPLEALASTIEEVVQERVDQDLFSGSVLVARDGRPVFARAYGMADREKDVDNTLDTPMGLASMSKMITGLAIAQLEAEGLLSYDDPIGKHLPDYPSEVLRDRATIHHLLTHTSGLGNYFVQEYWERKGEISDHEGFAALFAHEDPDFEPGDRFQYSNSGPVVLALILEAVTGESYYDYVREHVYGPAGMRNSDHYLLTEQSEAGFARAYYKETDDGPWISDEPMKGLRGSAAGSGYASANDLLRFAAAVKSGKLLSRDRVETLWTVHVPMGTTGGESAGYGYLWGVHSIEGMTWVGHNGGGGGVNTEFALTPEDDWVVIVLSNQAGGAHDLSAWIKETVGLSVKADREG